MAEHLRVYSDKEKQDVMEALGKGMGIGELALMTGIPYGTIFGWKSVNKSVKPAVLAKSGTETKTTRPAWSTNLAGVSGPEKEGIKVEGKKQVIPIDEVKNVEYKPKVIPVQPKMTLDEFCEMMITALREREMWKNKYHDLEISLEKWRLTAGKLNEQLQTINKF